MIRLFELGARLVKKPSQFTTISEVAEDFQATVTDEQIDTLLNIERLFEQAVEHAKVDYAKQTQHFKSLVKFENRLLFVYLSFLHIKGNETKEILTK